MSSDNNERGGAVTLVARILIIVEVAGLALMCLIFSNILPMKYLGIIIGVCVLVLALQIIMVAGGRRVRKKSVASIILSVILIAASVFAIFFMKDFYNNLNKMSTETQKTITTATQSINVYVRKADGLKLMAELSGRNIGILEAQDTKNTNLALEQLEGEFGQKPPTTSFQGILPLLNGLKDGTTDAILVNSAFSTALTENDTTFLDWAELLGTIDVTKEIDDDDLEHQRRAADDPDKDARQIAHGPEAGHGAEGDEEAKRNGHGQGQQKNSEILTEALKEDFDDVHHEKHPFRIPRSRG